MPFEGSSPSTWRQHSLPSGHYPLLEPDFHRLDRTSFAWRISITWSARPSRVRGIVARPGALAVFRLMTSSCLVDWISGRSAGFSPFQNAAGVDAGLAVGFLMSFAPRPTAQTSS